MPDLGVTSYSPAISSVDGFHRMNVNAFVPGIGEGATFVETFPDQKTLLKGDGQFRGAGGILGPYEWNSAAKLASRKPPFAREAFTGRASRHRRSTETCLEQTGRHYAGVRRTWSQTLSAF